MPRVPRVPRLFPMCLYSVVLRATWKYPGHPGHPGHRAFAKRRTRPAPFQHVSGSLPYVTPRAWMRDIA